MTLVQFFDRLIEKVNAIDLGQSAEHPHFALNPIVLQHLELLRRVAEMEPEKQRYLASSVMGSWLFVLEHTRAHGIFDEFVGNEQLRSILKEFISM